MLRKRQAGLPTDRNEPFSTVIICPDQRRVAMPRNPGIPREIQVEVQKLVDDFKKKHLPKGSIP